jgi:hypothetical protein
MIVTSFGEFGITPNEPGFVTVTVAVTVPSPTPCPPCAKKPMLGAWLAAAGAGVSASVVAVAGLATVLNHGYVAPWCCCSFGDQQTRMNHGSETQRNEFRRTGEKRNAMNSLPPVPPEPPCGFFPSSSLFFGR